MCPQKKAELDMILLLGHPQPFLLSPDLCKGHLVNTQCHSPQPMLLEMLTQQLWSYMEMSNAAIEASVLQWGSRCRVNSTGNVHSAPGTPSWTPDTQGEAS